MSSRTQYIDATSLKKLTELRPARTILCMIQDWAVIGAAIAVSKWISNPVVYVVAVLVIAGRMHGIGVLIHEFAHYRFHSGKTRSDWIGDLFLAWPVFATVDAYRQNHLAHHRYTNTEDDPDWVIKLGADEFTFPQTRLKALFNFLGYLIGVSSYRDIKSVQVRVGGDRNTSKGYELARFGYYICFALIFVATGYWAEFLLYWAVPYVTIFFFFLYVRSVAEHFGGMDYSHELGSSRHIDPHFWERWFFCPHNINHHLDHHLYPSVPFYNLPELHQRLLENREYREGAHITRGYSTGLARECLA